MEMDVLITTDYSDQTYDQHDTKIRNRSKTIARNTLTPLPRPEQVRALSYLKRKGTDAPIELLRQRIADAFAD